jgi:hypothetical protein
VVPDTTRARRHRQAGVAGLPDLQLRRIIGGTDLTEARTVVLKP